MVEFRTDDDDSDDGDDRGTANGIRRGVVEPALRGDELTVLLGFLNRQRQLVAWKVRDVPDGQLRSVSTPSGFTLHGVVRHLTNVDRSWIRDVFAAEPDLPFDWTDADPDGEWHVPDGVTMAELLADYAAEAVRCDAVVLAADSLDVVAAQGGFSLRWIVLHLIEETARHLGQIDVLREQVDGAVGEEPKG